METRNGAWRGKRVLDIKLSNSSCLVFDADIKSDHSIGVAVKSMAHEKYSQLLPEKFNGSGNFDDWVSNFECTYRGVYWRSMAGTKEIWLFV